MHVSRECFLFVFHRRVSCKVSQAVHIRVVHLTGCAQIMGRVHLMGRASHKVCATHGRVHLMGRASHRVCASHGHVHLMGVHLWACLFRGHAPQRPASYRRASHKTA